MEESDVVGLVAGFSSSRLQSLYSDFGKLYEQNPEGFEANEHAWTAAINTLLTKRPGYLSPGILVFPADKNFVRKFTLPQHGSPLGMGIVLNSGLRKGHFADFAEYVKHGAANSSRGHTWVFDSLFHALGLVRESCPINTLPNRELVALDIVPDVARCVLDQALQPTSTLSHLAYLYTFDEFYELYRYAWSKDASLSRDDMLVVLRHLDGRVIHDGPVRARSENSGKMTMTETEKSIADMRATLNQANRQADLTADKVDALGAKAKSSIAKGSKEGALLYLKQRKILQASWKRRVDGAQQLQQLLSSIDEAITNQNYLKLMQSGSHILAKTMEEFGGAEHVHDVMDELRDRLGENEEISQALRQTDLGGNETELTEELEQLQAEEKSQTNSDDLAELRQLRPPQAIPSDVAHTANTRSTSEQSDEMRHKPIAG